MLVLRQKILEKILREALNAVDPENAVKKFVKRHGNTLRVGHREYNLHDFGRIFVIGAGKATAPMAYALENILDYRLTWGAIVVKYGYSMDLDKIEAFEAGHPIPDQNGLTGTNKIIAHLNNLQQMDLVLCAFSGGGSALFVSPIEGINLEDKQSTTDVLLKVGAPIEAVNAVRKHLSRVKGGRLAKHLQPAHVVTLLLSDVVGDRLDVIASGPTVPDPTTYTDCFRILREYNAWNFLPISVRKVFEEGVANMIPETPKPGDLLFDKVYNIIVANNRIALEAAQDCASSHGYKPVIITSRLQGEAREVAKVIGAIIEEVRSGKGVINPPACVLFGGETTVTIKGSGKGGRNQELALALSIHLKDLPDWSGFVVGTDGTDGPTDAAGAWIDSNTWKMALQHGLDPHAYLSNNDSYTFFEQLNSLVKTGPTRTNVMDIVCVLVH